MVGKLADIIALQHCANAYRHLYRLQQPSCIPKRVVIYADWLGAGMA